MSMTWTQFRALATMAPADFEEFERAMDNVRRLRVEVARELAYERLLDRASNGEYTRRQEQLAYERRLNLARAGFPGRID